MHRGIIFFSSLAPEAVTDLSCLTTGSSDTLEVVWSPPTGPPVLSYLVEVREYIFQENQVTTVFQRQIEILPSRFTVDGLG